MTIYVITYHEFNHEASERKPLDERFLNSDKNFIYYLIDEQVPAPLKNKEVLLEKEIDPFLHEVGKKHLAEWSFLLAEEKHSFCSYPFFMISSRFYEKNKTLKSDLNEEWNNLFSYFDKYSWGYLPSNDRPMIWYNLAWKEKLAIPNYSRIFFFPFQAKFFHLVNDIYNVKIPEEYSVTSPLFCNYFGFRSREDLLAYVDFYKPLIDHIYDDKFQHKRPLSDYVSFTNLFRNERPFTFLLEHLSHLFFFKNEKKFFSLHYDGYYEIDERNASFKRINTKGKN